jgi:hypothetical protein
VREVFGERKQEREGQGEIRGTRRLELRCGDGGGGGGGGGAAKP